MITRSLSSSYYKGVQANEDLFQKFQTPTLQRQEIYGPTIKKAS